MGVVPIDALALTLGYRDEYHGRDAFLDECSLLPSARGQCSLLVVACHDLGMQALHLKVERPYRRDGFVDHQRFLLIRWIAETGG